METEVAKSMKRQYMQCKIVYNHMSVWSFVPDWALVCVEDNVEPIIREDSWDF